MKTSAFTPTSGQVCVSDSLTHYNYMKDPDRTFVHLGHGSLFGGNVSGGNEAVRFFASAVEASRDTARRCVRPGSCVIGRRDNNSRSSRVT